MPFHIFGYQLPWLGLLEILLIASICYTTCLVTYRLYFHPLKSYPGPKHAAATLWYECYYDVVRDGRFFKKIQQLHKQHGPIIRINPFELHIADSSFFNAFHGAKSDKSAWFYDSANHPLSSFGTAEAELHRTRRAALNPFFSRSSIEYQVPKIKAKVLELCQWFDGIANSVNSSFRIDQAFESLTFDVITELAYGKSYNTIGNVNQGVKYSETAILAQQGLHKFRMFPWLLKALKAFPPSAIGRLNPKLTALIDLQTSVRNQVVEILKDKTRSTANERKAKPTIFHQILSSDLPAKELTTQRLTEEGAILISAGFATTGRALTVTMFHLIHNPVKLLLLREELATAMPLQTSCPTSWSALEALPYLSAVIKEGMRLSIGISSRLPRVLTTPMTYGKWTIPAGSTVSMSSTDVLFDDAIFPEPEKFIPERWLGEQGKLLDKHFVVFGKGARQCVGMWIAWAEMFLTIATLVQMFDFSLAEGVDESAIALERDHLVPFPEVGKEGVTVMIRKRTVEA